MRVFLDDFGYMPEKAHFDKDAGWDIKSPIGFTLKARNRYVVDTGVHVEIPHGFVGMIKSKSGLNVKHGISSEGVIDEGFRGSIRVALYNNSDEDYVVEKGNKISQLVIMPISHMGMELVDSLDEFAKSERGEGGFGSTGK